MACEVTFELLPPVESGAPPVPVQVALCYSAADPFAVHAVFATGTEEIEWVFARELLAAGFTGPAGDGDVHIHPIPATSAHAGRPGGERTGRLVLELSSPSGLAVFATDAAAVGEFLLATYQLVPEGAELDSKHVDVDAELAALLATGQR
jgi:hypothetical protein